MQNIWLKLNLCQNKYPHSKLCIKAIFLRLKSSRHCLWCCDCSGFWKLPGDFGSFPAASHFENTQDSLSGVSLKLQLKKSVWFQLPFVETLKISGNRCQPFHVIFSIIFISLTNSIQGFDVFCFVVCLIYQSTLQSKLLFIVWGIIGSEVPIQLKLAD